jgi:ribosome-associated protein
VPGVYSTRWKTDEPKLSETIPTPRPKHLTAERPAESAELRLAVETLDDHKGLDIMVLDLRELSDATDYFVVASGSSDVHVRALAEQVEQALERGGRRAHHVEGVRAGRWALLDYFDFVVHVFHPVLREFYQLERLWADAPTRRVVVE